MSSSPLPRGPVAPSLSSSLSSYRCGAQAVSAKAVGPLALGAAILSVPAIAEAQITVTTGPVTAAPGGAYFTASTGQLSNNDTFGARAYLFVNDLSTSYFKQIGSGNYLFATTSGIATLFTNGQQIQGATFTAIGYLATGGPSVWSSHSGYVGFKSVVGGNTRYGWISVTVNDADVNNVTINAIGYNTQAGGILAGQTSAVPEPATAAALLAAGAAGLAFYRRRKNLQRAA